jgi:membrane fusion protein (multidrug efflux system)
MNAPQPPPTRTRTSRGWRLVAVIAAGLPLLVYAGLWLHERLTHVYTDDAHIAAGMITLSSRVAAPVTKADLMQGALVRKGDVLVELDARQATLELEALDARHAAMSAELAELESRIELVAGQVQSALARAQAQLAALEAAMAASNAQLKHAEREYRRLASMARGGHASAQALDQATFALEAARGRYRQAEAERDSAAAGVEEARLALRQPDLLEHRSEVLAARLNELDAARRQQALAVEDHTIRSPIDGVVDKVFVDSGEFVSAGQNLLMLHAPTDVWVEARVKETARAPLQVGQPVRLHVDAFPDRVYSGQVESIVSAATSQFALLPSPNPSGNFTKVTQRIPVRIRFDDPDPRLSPGMMVEVYIDIRR